MDNSSTKFKLVQPFIELEFQLRCRGLELPRGIAIGLCDECQRDISRTYYVPDKINHLIGMFCGFTIYSTSLIYDSNLEKEECFLCNAKKVG